MRFRARPGTVSTFAALALLCGSAAASLVGCSGNSETTEPATGGTSAGTSGGTVANAGSSGGGTNGGTAGSAAGSGGTAPGGGAGSAGSTGISGSAGSAGSSYVSPIMLDCAWEEALTTNCAGSTCHGPLRAHAGLLLVPDSGLITRLKDVPGTFTDIDCNPDPEVETPCETPPTGCTPLLGSKIVDSQNPEASLIMKKLTASGCGNQMPQPPGDEAQYGWGPDRLACLQNLVRAIAALPPGTH